MAAMVILHLFEAPSRAKSPARGTGLAMVGACGLLTDLVARRSLDF